MAKTLTERVKALENDMKALIQSDKETRRRLAALEQKEKEKKKSIGKDNA